MAGTISPIEVFQSELGPFAVGVHLAVDDVADDRERGDRHHDLPGRNARGPAEEEEADRAERDHRVGHEQRDRAGGRGVEVERVRILRAVVARDER